jgi:hypothetical protein
MISNLHMVLTSNYNLVYVLKVTFQACNLDEARLLYDQLANIAPLMVSSVTSG